MDEHHDRGPPGEEGVPLRSPGVTNAPPPMGRGGLLQQPPPTVTTPPDGQEEAWQAESRDQSPQLPPPVTNALRTFAAVVKQGNKVNSAREHGASGGAALTGTWTPIEASKIANTLAKDWQSPLESGLTPSMTKLQEVALNPTDVHPDGLLRQRTVLENEALVAYFQGGLELDHPPLFLKATSPLTTRMMIQHFHAEQIETVLTAVVPPEVMMRRNSKHITLCIQLHGYNNDVPQAKAMIARLLSDVKKIFFDGNHILHFVFPSRRVAHVYEGIHVRFQNALLQLEDTSTSRVDQTPGTFNSAQLRRLYAVKIYGADTLGIGSLVSALQMLPGINILDAEYPRGGRGPVIDNRYVMITFDKTDCPEPLKGVTHVTMNGLLLTIHHFQSHARRPCARCYSQHHMTPVCKVPKDLLVTTRVKLHRNFSGSVKTFKSEVNKHLNAVTLDTLDECMQDIAMALSAHASQGPKENGRTATLIAAPRPNRQALEQSGDELSLATDSPATEAQTGRRVANTSDIPSTLNSGDGAGTTGAPDAAGYSVAKSKSAKKRAAAAARRSAAAMGTDGDHNEVRHMLVQPSTSPMSYGNTAVTSGTTAAPSPHTTRKASGHAETLTQKSSQKRPLNKKDSYKAMAASFHKTWAEPTLGMHTLHPDIALEDERMSEPDDAAYAFPDEASENPPHETLVRPDESRAGSPAVATSTAPPVPPVEDYGTETEVQAGKTNANAVAKTDDIPMPQAASGFTAKAARVGIKEQAGRKTEEEVTKTASANKERRRLLHTSNRTGLDDIPATTDEKTEEKAGMIQTTMASFMSKPLQQPDSQPDSLDGGTASLLTTTALAKMEELVPAPPDSQEEFTMGRSHIGTDEEDRDSPIQVGQWLESFCGHEVEVATNGHCAFLALYATTLNHPGPAMKLNATTIKQATEMKAKVYECMMANLRHDVELGIVDPIEECARIFPGHPQHSSVPAATAGLFAHYAQARSRSVDSWVPMEFWAGQNELRTMAQFLREPLLVLDVNASNDAHVYRYLYKDHRLPDGAAHESGYAEYLSDRDAADYLRTCWELHVMPTFLVFRRHDRHFAGVGHGELYYRWLAEGDPAYTAGLPDSYIWKEDINRLTAEDRDVDITTVNLLATSPELDRILHRTMPSGDRWDVAHARRGVPTLDRQILNHDIQDILITEESILHEAYGVDAYAAANSTEQVGDEHLLPIRYTQVATGSTMRGAYRRILQAKDIIHLQDTDLPLRNLLIASNAEAFMKWCNAHRSRFNIPATRKRHPACSELYVWFLDHHEVMRHLFASLPYPELEAKRWPVEHLVSWGVAEAFSEQTAALARVMLNPALPKATRQYCQEWYDACMVPGLHPTAAYALAQSAARWKRLAILTNEACARAKPEGLHDPDWCILHVLPYTISWWNITAMGRAPRGERAVWHANFSFVRELCTSIVEDADWSAATMLTPELQATENGVTDDLPSGTPHRN